MNSIQTQILKDMKVSSIISIPGVWNDYVRLFAQGEYDSIRLRTGGDSIRFDSIIVSGKVERFDSERFSFDCRLLTIMKFTDKATNVY